MSLTRRELLISTLACAAAPQTRAETLRIPDVQLQDDKGRSHALRELIERHTVALNFIYTGCLSFCPPQTSVFRAVQTRLQELKDNSPYAPLLLSLSIDPLNDTPAALASYAARFDAKLGLPQRWLMLTGSAPTMEQAARAFRASTQRVDDHPALLWVGCAAKSRWQSAAGLANADDVLRMMKAASA